MSVTFFKTWAIAATAVALILTGIIIGRNMDTGVDAGARNNTGTGVNSSSGNTPDGIVDVFHIPESFHGLASEWRSVHEDENDFDGYAVLFGLQRRELIIEQCSHPGYFSRGEGIPIEDGTEFCQTLLWGTLAELNEQSAKVIDRAGNLIDLQVFLERTDGISQLTLGYQSHTLELIAGSKNDLFQHMDLTPEMSEQKQLRFAYQQDQLKKRLLAQQSEVVKAQPEIPRYTLPDTAKEQRPD